MSKQNILFRTEIPIAITAFILPGRNVRTLLESGGVGREGQLNGGIYNLRCNLVARCLIIPQQDKHLSKPSINI